MSQGKIDAPGYLNRQYALSLANHGRPRYLPQCGGWILVREIKDTGLFDGIGPYPLFCCKDWSKLPDDLATLRGELVTLTLVADPLGDYTIYQLMNWFDHTWAYKPHYIIDNALTPSRAAGHKRNIRKATKTGIIISQVDPATAYPAWCWLYGVHVSTRKGCNPLAKFGATPFKHQFQAPGLTAFAATIDGTAVAMALFYEMGNRAYYHLGASSREGRDCRAMFAIFDKAIEYFRPRVSLLDLGGGVGNVRENGDGLVRFKKGWANDMRFAHLCGKVFDRAAYDELSKGQDGIDYFPMYRKKEMGND
jgi:hypothetical protein